MIISFISGGAHGRYTLNKDKWQKKKLHDILQEALYDHFIAVPS